jgi:hypothetical protein
VVKPEATTLKALVDVSAIQQVQQQPNAIKIVNEVSYKPGTFQMVSFTLQLMENQNSSVLLFSTAHLTQAALNADLIVAKSKVYR